MIDNVGEESVSRSDNFFVGAVRLRNVSMMLNEGNAMHLGCRKRQPLDSAPCYLSLMVCTPVESKPARVCVNKCVSCALVLLLYS